MEIGFDLCPTWKTRLMNPSQSQRTARTKDAGETGELSQQLKAGEEAVAEEGEAMVVAEAEAVGTPMYRSSMEWTAKNSNGAPTQARYNRWALK